MKTLTRNKVTASERLLDAVIDIESVLNRLPELSVLEKAQLEHTRAIENLYYSSKLEGTTLTRKRIDQAIYGQQLSAT